MLTFSEDELWANVVDPTKFTTLLFSSKTLVEYTASRNEGMATQNIFTEVALILNCNLFIFIYLFTYNSLKTIPNKSWYEHGSNVLALTWIIEPGVTTTSIGASSNSSLKTGKSGNQYLHFIVMKYAFIPKFVTDNVI